MGKDTQLTHLNLTGLSKIIEGEEGCFLFKRGTDFPNLITPHKDPSILPRHLILNQEVSRAEYNLPATFQRRTKRKILKWLRSSITLLFLGRKVILIKPRLKFHKIKINQVLIFRTKE